MEEKPNPKKRKEKTKQKKAYTVEKLSFYKFKKTNKVKNNSDTNGVNNYCQNSSNTESIKHVISNPKIPQFSLIDFKKKTQSTTDSFKYSSTMYKFNLRKSNNEPLPNHVYSPTQFQLKNIKWTPIQTNYANMDVILKNVIPFNCFGEDDSVLALQRKKLELLLYNSMLHSTNNYVLFAMFLWSATHTYVMQHNKENHAIEMIKNSDDLLHFEIEEGINASYFSKDVNAKILTNNQLFSYANRLIDFSNTGRFDASKRSILNRMRLYYKKSTLILGEKLINELNNYHYFDEDNEKVLQKWSALFVYNLVNLGISFFDKPYFNPLIDAVKKNFHFSYFKAKVLKQAKLHPTPHSQLIIRSVSEVDQFFNIHLNFNIKSIFIPPYDTPPFFELLNSLKHFYYKLHENSYQLFNALSNNYSKVDFYKRNYDKYGQIVSDKVPSDFSKEDKEYCRYRSFNNRGINLTFFKITIEFMEVIVLEIQEHKQSGKDTFDPKKLYYILRMFFKTDKNSLNFIQEVYQSFNLLEKIFYLFRLTLSSILDNIFPHSNYFYSMKFSFFIFGYNFEFCQSILNDLLNAYNEKTLTEPQYRYLYLTVIYLIRTASFFRYRHTTFRRSFDIINPYPKTPEFENNRTKSRAAPIPEFINEVRLTTLYNCPIKYENYPRKNPNFLEDSKNINSYHNRPNDPNNLIFNSDNFEINTNVDSNYQEVSRYLHENFYQYGRDVEISQIPIKYLKISEFGLLLNIDHRPNLINKSSNYISNSDTMLEPQQSPESFKFVNRIFIADDLIIRYKIDSEILLELSEDKNSFMKEYENQYSSFDA